MVHIGHGLVKFEGKIRRFVMTNEIDYNKQRKS